MFILLLWLLVFPAQGQISLVTEALQNGEDIFLLERQASSISDVKAILQSNNFKKLSSEDQLLILDRLLERWRELFAYFLLDIPTSLQTSYEDKFLKWRQEETREKMQKNQWEQELLSLLPNRQNVYPRAAFAPPKQLRRLLKDRALQYYPEINPEWIDNGLLPLQELIRLRVILSRNLYFQGLPPTEQNVTAEITEIFRLREKIKNRLLFTGQNVVFWASEDERFFGRLGTRQKIREQQPRTLRFDRIFTDLPEDKDGLTFVFEGHGRADALQIEHGISPTQLSHLLEPYEEDKIVLIWSCWAHDFIRQLLPHTSGIFIVPEEVGQLLLNGPQEGDFFAPTLGDLLENEKNKRTSVYVSSKGGQIRQVY